jgi:hypothetical protein
MDFGEKMIMNGSYWFCYHIFFFWFSIIICAPPPPFSFGLRRRSMKRQRQELGSSRDRYFSCGWQENYCVNVSADSDGICSILAIRKLKACYIHVGEVQLCRFLLQHVFEFQPLVDLWFHIFCNHCLFPLLSLPILGC